MDWLKDKKNQPIVAAILAVVIVGALAAVLLPQFLGKGDDTASAPPQDDPNAAGMMGGPPPGGMMPGAPQPGAMPGTPQAAPPAGGAPPAGAENQTAAPAAGAGTQTAAVTPMEPWRDDPFLPIGYKPKPNQPKPKPRIHDLPIENWSRIPPPDIDKREPDIVQPVRRMAGLIVSDRLFAIIETEGTSEIVQPGDMLKDRKAYVQKIERDKVVLKTVDRRPKYLTVRMAAAPKVEVSEPATSGGGSMTMPGGRRFPGMMGPIRPGPAGPMQPM